MNIKQFLKAPEHRWARGNIDLNDKDKLVWTVCAYLRETPEQCKGCPESFIDPEHGKMHHGCRMIAEEVISICKHGHPWAPR